MTAKLWTSTPELSSHLCYWLVLIMLYSRACQLEVRVPPRVLRSLGIRAGRQVVMEHAPGHSSSISPDTFASYLGEKRWCARCHWPHIAHHGASPPPTPAHCPSWLCSSHLRPIVGGSGSCHVWAFSPFSALLPVPLLHTPQEGIGGVGGVPPWICTWGRAAQGGLRPMGSGPRCAWGGQCQQSSPYPHFAVEETKVWRSIHDLLKGAQQISVQIRYCPMCTHFLQANGLKVCLLFFLPAKWEDNILLF